MTKNNDEPIVSADSATTGDVTISVKAAGTCANLDCSCRRPKPALLNELLALQAEQKERRRRMWSRSSRTDEEKAARVKARKTRKSQKRSRKRNR